jgi:hypothetical protein
MASLSLDKGRSGILIVDVQTKLMSVMRRGETVAENIIKLLKLSGLFSLPVLVTEQYPRMMGPTLPEIKKALPVYEPLEKMQFNCCSVSGFNERLRSADLKTSTETIVFQVLGRAGTPEFKKMLKMIK